MRERLLSVDLAITMAFAAIAAIALLQANEWPFRAKLFPLATAGALLIAALLKAIIDVTTPRPAPKPIPTRIEDEEEDSEAELVDVFATASSGEWTQAIGWMAAFFLLLWLLGALVAVPLFAIVYLFVVARASVAVMALYALVTWAFVYGLFIRLLHIPLPTGVLWGAS